MPIVNIGVILSARTQIGGDAIEDAVARAYLVKHVNDFDRAELNVPLGPAIAAPAGTPAFLIAKGMNSWRSRADMILWRGNIPTIVEVKNRARASVLGQLLTYYNLLRADNPTLLQVYKVVAAQTLQPGMMPTFEQYNVQVELFPGAAAAAGINS